jgi:hypothetical protein
LKNFRSLACGTDGVGVTSETSTGVASITVDQEGGNCIVIVPAANNLVTAAWVESQRALIERAKVLVTQLEVPLEATIRALEIGAASPSTTTIFNPAPADTVLPESIYALCDLVIPNETEAALLTGIAVNDPASAERAARLLLAKGAKNVIVTLGGQGCLLVPGARGRRCRPRRRRQGARRGHDRRRRLVHRRAGALPRARRLARAGDAPRRRVRLVLGAAQGHAAVVCHGRRHRPFAALVTHNNKKKKNEEEKKLENSCFHSSNWARATIDSAVWACFQAASWRMVVMWAGASVESTHSARP